MTVQPPRVRKFSSAIDENATRFDDRIVILPGLDKTIGRSMSAYTAFLQVGARADLTASYAEIWVVLSGSLRIGTGTDAVTAQSGDYLHIPEQTAGEIEALEETTIVCVSVPAH